MAATLLSDRRIWRFILAACAYSAAFVVLVLLLRTSGSLEAGGMWLIVPAVAVAAFLFQVMDSAVGMGLGTALSPLLIAMGYTPLEIVPTLLIAQMFTGLLSGWMHREIGNIRVKFFPPDALGRLTLGIIGAGVCGAVLSVLFVYEMFHLSDRVIETYVALLVIATGIYITAHKPYKEQKTYHSRRLIAFSALAAVNKGVGGGGYGPVLTMGAMASGLSGKQAVGLAVLSEGIISIAGVLTFFVLYARGLEVSFILLPSVLAGTFLSALFAPFLTRLCPPHVFHYLIPAYSVLIGLFVLAKLYLFSL